MKKTAIALCIIVSVGAAGVFGQGAAQAPVAPPTDTVRYVHTTFLFRVFLH